MKDDFCNGCAHNAVCGYKAVACDIANYIIAFSARVPKYMQFDFDLICKYRKCNTKLEVENAIRKSNSKETAQDRSAETV